MGVGAGPTDADQPVLDVDADRSRPHGLALGLSAVHVGTKRADSVSTKTPHTRCLATIELTRPQQHPRTHLDALPRTQLETHSGSP
jgi:hypothetical protein